MNRAPVIVVAPDAFKHACTAHQATRAITRGLREALPGALIDEMPLADGGEGTLDVLVNAGLAERIPAPNITRADRRCAPAAYARLHDADRPTVLIEAAIACGWSGSTATATDPRTTTTRGVGELMLAALTSHPRPARILVALGGSRTVDGGAGMLQGLGATLLDDGEVMLPPGGGELERLAMIDLAPARARLTGVELVALCDVTSPLLGPDGARLYMAQKGADTEACRDQLERGLARLVGTATPSTDEATRIAALPGAGAAGGLGAGLALLGARLEPGIQHLLDRLDADTRIAHASLVVTGEGRVDGQTLEGKVVNGIAALAQRHGVPVVVLCGQLDPDDDLQALLQTGVTTVLSIADGPGALDDALAATAEHLERTAHHLGRLLAATDALR